MAARIEPGFSCRRFPLLLLLTIVRFNTGGVPPLAPDDRLEVAVHRAPLVRMASQKKPSTKSATARAPRTGAVAAFIRSQPADMKPTALVDAGRAAGFTFGPAYVYTVRGRAQRPAKKSATAKSPRVRNAVGIAARAASPREAGAEGSLSRLAF